MQSDSRKSSEFECQRDRPSSPSSAAQSVVSGVDVQSIPNLAREVEPPGALSATSVYESKLSEKFALPPLPFFRSTMVDRSMFYEIIAMCISTDNRPLEKLLLFFTVRAGSRFISSETCAVPSPSPVLLDALCRPFHLTEFLICTKET